MESLLFSNILIPELFKKNRPSQKKINDKRKIIKKTGNIGVFVVDKSNYLIDGYARYIVLKEQRYQGAVQIIRGDWNFSTKSDRKRIYLNDQGRCYLCGDKIDFENMTVDHVIPLSRNGMNTKENMRCCCIQCNQMKNNLMPGEFIEKIKQLYENNIAMMKIIK